MEELLTYLIGRIVNKPENITLETGETNQGLRINLKIDKEDLSKVIGKNGKTIQAIRTLLQAYLTKKGTRSKKVFLDLKAKEL